MRATIVNSGMRHYHIFKETGVRPSVIAAFVRKDRPYLRSDTIDKLCEYFGLELVEKKQKKGAKTATKRRPKTVPQSKTRP